MVNSIFSSERWLSRLVKWAAWGVLFFLYFPLLVIILYSFNDAAVAAFPIEKFSTRWYGIMLADESLMSAVRSSFFVAIVSTGMAVLLGLPAAYAIYQTEFPGKGFLERVVLMPLTLPGIVTGVAMLSFFPLVGVHISLTAVIVGHTTFLLALVVTQMVARFKRLDPFLEYAAADLGATPIVTFFSIILPNIRTALIGTILLCLVLSMDEIPVTFFLIARENTLPIEIYGMMRRGITPEVNAISTVVFLLSSIAVLISIQLSEQNNRA